ncbi:acyl-CoA dehydrogenase family protein, partial [Actinoplanes subglobosus]
MAGLSPAELQEFADAVDGVLSTTWPQPRIAGEDADGGRLSAVWAAAAEYGWTDLYSDEALDAVVTALGRLGRHACPLPLMDTYVAARLLAGDSALTTGIADGSVRPVVVTAGRDVPSVRYVEGATAATHVVLLLPTEVLARAIDEVTETPGLAKPSWSDVRLGAQVLRATPGVEAIENAKALLRLGLAARAVGAAERTVEHSLVHAKERIAFGKPIGAFQAVSHRAVDGATDMTAARGLIREAVEAHLTGRDSWQLAVQLAVQFAVPAATRAQFGAQHTLAASGYFEEHDAPWLFRRVHADASLLDAITLRAGDVADILISTGAGLPSFELGERAEQFRREVREFTARFRTDAAVEHFDNRNREFQDAAAAAGYVTLAWPAAAGG